MGTEESREVMKTDESDMQQDQADPTRLISSDLARGLLMATGVVIPAACFLIGYPGSSAWQSGDLRDYAQLLLNRPSCMPLYPFLLYSMVCLTLLVLNPAKWSKMFVVRLGIYGGVLLALEHWVLFAFADSKPIVMLIGTGVGALLFGGLIVLVLWAVAYHFRRCVPFFAMGVIVALLLLLVFGESACEFIVGLFFFDYLYFSTPWAVAAYSIVSLDLLRHQGTGRFRFSLAQLFGVITWLAAHFGAWRASVNWMLIEYAKLPTTPEDCYVCTAAAKGHGWLTRTERCRCPSGRRYRVSDQMRRLKAIELILRYTSPRLHRTCRAIYDRIGPALAARLVHPWLADVAYLSLKPLEWSCCVVLRGLLPKSSMEAIRGLYGKEEENSRQD
ncbi:MAG: DUF6688 family protein [Thermoguttaceae bacterium]